MNNGKDNHVSVKVFVGYELTPDIKMSLAKSAEWKQDLLTAKENPTHLEQACYQEKDYIGRYMEYQTLIMHDLKEAAEEIKTKLRHYYPTLITKNLKTSIFPQVFVA